jgi:type 1 fimbria pilin
MLNVQSAQTDETNTNVVTNADTATTNVGVLFQLASGTSVVNTGSVSLTSGGGDLDNTGSIHFKAQPYAVAATIAPGIIGGVVTYTVAYL